MDDAKKVENDIELLKPLAVVAARTCVGIIKEMSLPFAVYETIRTIVRQTYLVSQGYSKTLDSMHLHGMAFDIVYRGWTPLYKLGWAWPGSEWKKHFPWFDAYLKDQYMSMVKLLTARVINLHSGLLEWKWDEAHLWVK